MRQLSSSQCDHRVLTYDPSPASRTTGYQNYTPKQLTDARTSTTKRYDCDSDLVTDKEAFLGPLVLPGDDLTLDPEYPPQSVEDWVEEKKRNKVTRKRNVIYVAGPPLVDQSVNFAHSWARPGKLESTDVVQSPSLEDIVEYLGGFYHGMPTRILPLGLEFAAWEDGQAENPTKKLRYIALNTGSYSTRIRTRQDPTKIFQGQLNLNDILDAGLDILPHDAYALMLLVDQDLYEDEDDFCCGRAYGGNRIAVVSTARYDPGLDELQNIDKEHVWPASHCEAFVEECCNRTPARSKIKKSTRSRTDLGSAENPIEVPSSPISPSNGSSEPVLKTLQGAVAAHNQIPPITSSSSSSALSGLWMSRVCRTVSYELGHCFGIDHCVYYACVMQGSASLAEDFGQPPYLCPIDLEKVVRATKANARERYEALLVFCQKHENVHVFAAFGAWLDSPADPTVM